MDFIDELNALSVRIKKQCEHIQTEEATKTAMVLPFINVLGYNVFDPTEVTPELNADVGIKKGEKVDYAILKGGKPVILIECKGWQADLDQVHASQLYRYFSVTEARIGVLTNGINYRFFSDLEQPNKMDEKPFLEIDLFNLREPLVQELKRLRKTSFDLNEMVTAAGELKYTKEIRRIFQENASAPTDDFVRFFASQVYSGRMTRSVLDEFAAYTKKAISQYLSDRISDRLRSALDQEETTVSSHEQPAESLEELAAEEDAAEAGVDPGVYTTDDERQGYYIVTAIMSEVTDPARVHMRDTKTYCGIILDDNNRKPICRLWFNRAQYYIGLFGENKKEERVPIDSLRDIYQHASRLKAMIGIYDA